jgi:hypothetical protein
MGDFALCTIGLIKNSRELYAELIEKEQPLKNQGKRRAQEVLTRPRLLVS